MNNSITDEIGGDIAIIGMSGLFPGAKNIDEFWQNLKNGVESITAFSDQELIDAGIKPSVLTNTHYVKAKGFLDNVPDFDATFFGLSPKEAEITDPQQRLFLECAWEALENAGYDPQTYSGAIGIYGGVGGFDTYLSQNLLTNQTVRESTDKYQMLIGNDKDFLCTRISYKLNLNGPSITVQTACSTSLVAVVMACKSLLSYQCDMVLAGGSAISLPAKSGYFYQDGMILSPDGHCRAFDAKAQGTVPSNGVGLVVLKRLEEAIADRDHIHAIIKGAAINNDGTLKVGYTAPSIEGQMQVIAEALAYAEIPVKSIGYIECHGTGTPLGDPIEIAALTKLFRTETDKKGYCAIGSVKTNIGHLDIAAGIAGLIKTVLALEHQLIPPSLHFDTPNPKLDLDNSPFYVNTQLTKWQTTSYPRRAGVSAFGMGGTNAHVVLEEAPSTSPSKLGFFGNDERNSRNPTQSNRAWQLLLLSAKTDTVLETATIQLADHLKQHPHLNLADVAYTYQVGRRTFNHRRMLVCQMLPDTITALETPDVKPVFSHTVKDNEKPAVVFMFSGQGTQYVNMGWELYQTEPVFREQVDRCAEWLKPHLGLDLRRVMYPKLEIPPLQKEKGLLESKALALESIDQTAITQPALFVIEYALAQLWMAWGIQPKAMIGHSIGEYVAACLAGVFTLEEALMLVAARGRLMQSIPSGAMLAVPLSEEKIQPFLNENLDLAAINVSAQSVISGPIEAVEHLATQLAQQGIDCQRLHTSHAFHSEMMAPILPAFLEQVQKIALQPPKIPFISNVTGTWISNTEASDPNYWITHLRQTVRFALGLQTLLKEPASLLLEIGPGRTLSTFAKRHPDNAGQLVLTSLRHPKEVQSDSAFLLNTLGQLWLAGMTVNWENFQAHEQPYRLPLPTYPFERQRYWIEPQTQMETLKDQPDGLHKKTDIADWFYMPSWKRVAPPVYDANAFTESSCWLVFMDECGLGSQLVKRLQQQGQDVITVTVGEQLTGNAQKYTLNPQHRDDYEALLQALLAQHKRPQRIIHCWTVTPNYDTESGQALLDKSQNLGFYSLLFLTQALGKHNVTDALQIYVVSNHLQAVTSDELLRPEKATVLGPCKVIPQEYPNITCQSIDIVLPDELGTWQADKLIEALLAEFIPQKRSDLVIAYRGQHRWVQTFEPIRLEPQTREIPLRDKGVYLITGGLGNIGLVLAEFLARAVQAKLILIGRSAFPNHNEWKTWLATHDEQDDISRKILKIQTLESLGAEVLIFSADVANYEQMQATVTQAEKHFGQPINGVIHGAGIIKNNTFRAIQEMGQNECMQQFLPKVQGLYVLEKVLSQKSLDFCLLMSSLSAILGGIGYIAYSSANLFMDAFADRHNRCNAIPWLSINWDGWQFDEKTNTSFGISLAELAIIPEEGGPAFRKILSSGSHQIIVSTGDLQHRLKQWTVKQKDFLSPDTQKSSITHSRPILSTSYVAPRNQIEQTIAEILQKFLGIKQIGIHDDFFDLGGDSLLAVQLTAKLREVVNIELSPHSLLNAPTIAKLGEFIEHLRSTSATHSNQPLINEMQQLVKIRSGKKKPLFLPPPAGGTVYSYRELAQYLPLEQPVYGIQPQGLDGKNSPLAKIEEIATQYVRLLRAVQPDGPYFLGGASFGGTVAFEMAQQLKALEQEVALIAMIDTPSPGQQLAAFKNDVDILVYLLNVVDNFAISSDELQQLSYDEQLQYFLSHGKMAHKLLPEITLDQLRYYINLFKCNLQAGLNYKPQIYSGKIIFFRANERDEINPQHPELGWFDLATEGVEVYGVPGNHITMNYPPHVEVMAKQLKAYLN
jgi:acyl transferase domain-containing protein/thioesterase domain-containing protein/acyl carrier protein